MAAPSAGILDQQIEVLKTEIVRDKYGSQVEAYSPFAKVWAHVTHAHGQSAISVGETFATDSISLLMRYTTIIGERQMLRWQGRLYRVQGSPVGSRREGSLTVEAVRWDEGNPQSDTTSE